MDDAMQTERMDWRMYEDDLEALCDIKAEEFKLLGYGEVRGVDVWNCVRSTHRGQTSLHELVGAVLGLQVGKFMNYTTVNAYKGVFDSEQAGRRLF